MSSSHQPARGASSGSGWHRLATSPDFYLSRAGGSLRSQGALATYTDPWEAAAALQRKRHQYIVGAIPFDTDHPAALTVPRDVIRSDSPLEPPAAYRGSSPASGRITREIPTPADHRAAVAAAVGTICKPGSPVEKVVLARAVEAEFQPGLDPLRLAALLLDGSPNRDGFLADLSPAGGAFENQLFVGSSPEMLVRRHGQIVEAFPLAGSLPRHGATKDEAAARDFLYGSQKNLSEHAFVVDDIVASLAPLCHDISAPARPELMSTSEMWHLGSRITGRLRDPETTALDLALAVHPTPAICGTPTDAARMLIDAAEPTNNRGFYAGAVGWCDSDGDGEYVVAIRCAQISADGSAVRAWAGGGIVADSDPDDELAETYAKFQTIMRALGLRY